MVIAIANLALVVDHGAVKVAAGSVGPTIIRARGAEQWAEANGGVDADATEFGRRVGAEARPIDDHRSTAAYRRHAVEVMAARAAAASGGPRERALPRCTSTASTTTSPTRGSARACSTCCASGSGCRAAKGACEQGECGSCSVLVDDGWCARAWCSRLGGRAARSPRSRASPPTARSTDVQQAFVDAGAVQCGFCTPGLVIAVHDLLERNPEPDRARDPRGAVRQPVPLHRLRPDPRGGARPRSATVAGE